MSKARNLTKILKTDNPFSSADIALYLGYTPVSPTQLNTALDNLVAGAPGALNTLDELSAALGDDANFAATVTNALAGKASTSWVNSLLVPSVFSSKDNTDTGGFVLPKGTTAQRYNVLGSCRYNYTIGKNEVYDSEGWTSIASPPQITSVSPSTYNGEQGTSFTINGAFFDAGATVKFITNAGTEYSAATVSRVNSSQLVATTPIDFTVAQEPLKVKVINSSGLSYILESAIDCGGVPIWTTAAGTLATVVEDEVAPTISLQAGDPDAGASISYSIITGSLPTGMSMTAGGIITGTPNVNGTYSTGVTHNFDIAAIDNAGNQTVRSFNIIRKWRDGSTQALAAPSGYWLAQNIGNTYLSTGTYWIKSASMPNALQMWVDMSEEGGGYDFYAFQGNGTSVTYANSSHSGTPLGLDIVYPRSKYHWRAMSNYVRNGGLAGSYSSYFQIPYGVHKTSGGGNYTGTIMRSAAHYGSGSSDHRVNDGGRWWLRDSTFGEPNGDYTAYAWFGLQAGGYTFPNPYNLEDIGFNDGSASFSTGGYYLVSTNAKP